MIMATLKVNDKELNIISRALELYSRIGILQMEEILNHPSIDKIITDRFTEKKVIEVGDKTTRGIVVEIGDDYVKTEGFWGNGNEIKTWHDIDKIRLSPDWGELHETTDTIKQYINQIKFLVSGESFGVMGHLGIHNPDVDDSCRVAFDMHQVIRNEKYKLMPDEDKTFSVADSVYKTSVDNNNLIKVDLSDDNCEKQLKSLICEINRLEIIETDKGRTYTNNSVKPYSITPMFQDDNKTLKLVLNK